MYGYIRSSNKGGETYDTSVILEVEEDTVGASPGLALTDNNGGHDLLTELGLSLLDSGHDHVTDTGSGETVETGTSTLNRDDVQVTSTGVVAAVHNGAAVKRSS
jgi:hypothetical protein